MFLFAQGINILILIRKSVKALQLTAALDIFTTQLLKNVKLLFAHGLKSTTQSPNNAKTKIQHRCVLLIDLTGIQLQSSAKSAPQPILTITDNITDAKLVLKTKFGTLKQTNAKHILPNVKSTHCGMQLKGDAFVIMDMPPMELTVFKSHSVKSIHCGTQSKRDVFVTLAIFPMELTVFKSHNAKSTHFGIPFKANVFVILGLSPMEPTVSSNCPPFALNQHPFLIL